jgi:hypothetical protein
VPRFLGCTEFPRLSRTAIAASKDVGHWSLTTLREKFVNIGVQAPRHSKYLTFQLVEVTVTRNLFAAILNRIERLTAPVVVACYVSRGLFTMG